jgi:tetratricopeptide (TPR) repeat protein
VVVATLPVLGLVPFEFERRSIVADHYLYLAMLGPALAFASILASARPKKIAAAIAVCCLLACGIQSYLQTKYWRDTVALFEHELTVNPASGVAYNSLAERAMMNHRPDEAEKLAQRAIEVQPDQIEAYVNLASALAMTGRMQKAIEVSREAVRLNPDNPRALASLAVLLDEQSNPSPAQLEEAVQLCRRSVTLDGMWPFSRRKLSGMLLHRGDLNGALREAQEAVQLDANDPRNQIALASALNATRQPNAALEHVNQALQLDPTFPPALQLQRRLGNSPRQ